MTGDNCLKLRCFAIGAIWWHFISGWTRESLRWSENILLRVCCCYSLCGWVILVDNLIIRFIDCRFVCIQQRSSRSLSPGVPLGYGVLPFAKSRRRSLSGRWITGFVEGVRALIVGGLSQSYTLSFPELLMVESLEAAHHFIVISNLDAILALLQ